MKDITNYIFFIVIGISCCNAKFKPCNESVESKVCILVDDIDDYVPTNTPKPLPAFIDITITVNNIIEVDEEKQTVSLSLQVTLEWNDTRLSANHTHE